MTGTRDGEWEDVDGPDSGVGIDYWYVHAAGKLEAYINVDQSRVSISVTEADGGEIEALEFDIEETEDAA